jgi:uncharacterized protein (DUF924 family)
MTTGYQDIIDFWFSDRVRKMWWSKDKVFDEEIRIRFGRYPHRNKIFGRESTPEEAAFLEQPGSSF